METTNHNQTTFPAAVAERMKKEPAFEEAVFLLMGIDPARLRAAAAFLRAAGGEGESH